MEFLHSNTLRPQLTSEEIADFITAPDPIDDIPEIFKNCPKMLDLEVADITQIPAGLSKKAYEYLKKETKTCINALKLEIRKIQNEMGYTGFMEMRMEDLIEREKNIKKRIDAAGKEYSGDRLQQAKQVPIDTLIEVRHGFASCPLHVDKTPSLKIYPNENRWHCFSCGSGGDTVDLIMAKNGITMPEAIKTLVGS